MVSDNSGKEIYVSHFSVEKQWVLHEHRIKSQAIVPGTALLEMVRAAFEKHAGNEAVEISNVFFLKPLIVRDNEKKEVRTILTKNEGGFDFSIISSSKPGENQWVEHVSGAIASVNTGLSEKTEISKIEAICHKGEIIDAERLHGSQFNLVEFGPRWRNRLRVKFGENEGLAVLELPDAFITDLESYKLHPALLDSATAFMMGQFKEGAQYLPFLWKKVKISKALPQKILSFAKYVGDSHSKKETLNFDILIMNEQGEHLMEIKDYTLRRVDVERFTKEMAHDQSKDSDPPERILEDNLLKAGLLPQEGVAVFSRALLNDIPQLIISTQDLNTRIEQSHGASIQRSDKIGLDRPMHLRPEMSTSYMAPRDEYEQIIADVWEELLGIQQIGIHDDFFELGGHSLVATQIISRLHKKFGIELPISSIFESSTIAEMADRVKAIQLANMSKVTAMEGLESEREEIEI
jgi:acyl carrier protein